MQEEIWKDVPEYVGYYQVSNLGNVRSVDRIVQKSNGVKQLRKGRIKKQFKNPDGYLTVKLCKDTTDVRYPVHVLVARAFIGYPENEDYEINHKDTNRANNMVENLEWVTHAENVKYSADLGHYKHYGADNSNYGNRTLSEKYKQHPELTYVQARKGKQNGRCIPITVENISTNETIRFDYIREAAAYFIEHKITNRKSTSVNRLGSTLKQHLVNGKTYCGYKISYA